MGSQVLHVPCSTHIGHATGLSSIIIIFNVRISKVVSSPLHFHLESGCPTPFGFPLSKEESSRCDSARIQCNLHWTASIWQRFFCSPIQLHYNFVSLVISSPHCQDPTYIHWCISPGMNHLRMPVNGTSLSFSMGEVIYSAKPRSNYVFLKHLTHQ